MTKVDQSKFLYFDPVSMTTCNLTTDEVISDWIAQLDSGKDYDPQERKREGKRNQPRNYRNEGEKKAKVVLMHNRQLDINTVWDTLLAGFTDVNGKPPGKEVLEQLQSLIEASCKEMVEVEIDGEMETFEASVVGINGSAASEIAKDILIAAIGKKSSRSTPKKKRNQKVYMRRGGDGLVLAYAYHGSNIQEQLEAANAKMKSSSKEVAKYEKHVHNLETHKEKFTATYWEEREAKSDALDSLCFAFEVPAKKDDGTANRADDKRQILGERLRSGMSSITPQQIFDQKLEYLKEKLHDARSNQQDAVAALQDLVGQVDEDEDDSDEVQSPGEEVGTEEESAT